MINNTQTSNVSLIDNLLAQKTSNSVTRAPNVNNETYSRQAPKISPQRLTAILQQFKGHSLGDLNKATLMNRVDSKFVLPIAMLPNLLKQLTPFYSVLEINNKRISNYHNHYFDTPHMALYQHHHNGKLNRYKVRRRHYIDTDTQFLEVKFKNNQKRTIKTRMKLTGEVGEHSLCAQFIEEELGEASQQLDICQQSGYQRIAFANEAQAERLTVDFDLWYQNRKGNKKISLPGFFIAELKQSKISKRSPFYQLMSRNNIFPTSFSKYCIGCALLYNTSLKTNRFKATLSHIEKFNPTQAISLFKSN